MAKNGLNVRPRISKTLVEKGKYFGRKWLKLWPKMGLAKNGLNFGQKWVNVWLRMG